MKRPMIVVQQRPYDWETAKGQIGNIAGHFAAYLSQYRSRRATGSKHAVLGPVGKLLNKAAAGERNLDSLLGYTVRIHEMSSEGGYLAPEALDHLRQGAQGLLNLLADAPVAVRSRLIEQIDDAVYYQHQKRRYEWLHRYMGEKREAFIAFLRAKYNNDEEQFEVAWGGDAVPFDEVRYPSQSQQQKARSKAKAQDIRAFWESLKEIPAEEEEEIE
jgi:hypothetical protein